MGRWNRREFVTATAAGAAVAALPRTALADFDPLKAGGRRVVVLGGGFGGTIAAKSLRRIDPSIEVVLVERERTYVACPTSNLVLAGTRKLEDNRIGYDRLAKNNGIIYLQDDVTAIDVDKKQLVGRTGQLTYDRLILSPGIDFRFDEIAGYDPAKTPMTMPHAWKAGDQTLLLRQQLEAMRDGGVVVVTIPLAPFRCPPGPYERICQIAWYLKQAKPKSKIIVLDANPDIVSKAGLFHKAWNSLYPGLIDYRSNQGIVRVSPEKSMVHTDVEDIAGDVINVIPPQKAAAIAAQAGLIGDDKRWCPVNQTTFESTRVPNIHVIGDAAIVGPMPKSGFSANTQAKVCAMNLAATLNGRNLIDPSSSNVCYSFVSDRQAVSIAAVYKVVDGKTVAVPNAGGVSADLSEVEAQFARAWIANILAEMST